MGERESLTIRELQRSQSTRKRRPCPHSQRSFRPAVAGMSGSMMRCSDTTAGGLVGCGAESAMARGCRLS